MPSAPAPSHSITPRSRSASRPTRVIAAASLVVLSGLGLIGSVAGARQPASPAQGVASRVQSERINPNTADASRLTLLPRIGPVLAERIVQDRDEHGPFQGAADLQRVRGIGPKTVERIAPMLSFEADPPAGDPRRSPAEP